MKKKKSLDIVRSPLLEIIEILLIIYLFVVGL